VTLTCQASFSSVSPVAQFRYQVGGGAFVEDPTSFPIDTGTGQATKNITIDQTGTWLAQCRVCTDSTAASCTGWGQVDGIGGPSLPPPPEPPGPPVPEQASCDLSLSAGSVSCGGGSCSGTLRWTNNVVVNIIQTNRVIAASQQPPSGSKQISARTAADLAISCQTTNGQTLDTLSGGESQRLKLASKLQAKGEFYILDEPTSGLHFADVEKLLVLLNRLVDNGNTVLIIEHNLDVIKNADWVIDLGPEGGERGGRIIAQGTPIQISQANDSYTGNYLKGLF